MIPTDKALRDQMDSVDKATLLEDLAAYLVANGPGILEAVIKVLEEKTKEALPRWYQEFRLDIRRLLPSESSPYQPALDETRAAAVALMEALRWKDASTQLSSSGSNDALVFYFYDLT